MTETSFKKLEKIIGYEFHDRHWLERALTHSSTNDSFNYQRLEFLGDRVLGLVLAHAIFEKFQHENEGGLAKRHTALVQGETCTQVGQEHNIGDFILLSDSERGAGGHLNENIISDVVEALLGAIYVDGGYEAAEKVILTLWGDRIETMNKAPLEPKTELQEWAQARALDLPLYEVIEKRGPDHSPVFIVQVTILGFAPVQAEGASKRSAEKIAAQMMLKIVKESA